MEENTKNSSLQKQQQFAVEYVKDHNATQAAIRAGYARKGAAASGKRLLENPKVQSRIQQVLEAKREMEKKAALPGLEPQEILDFLTLVLRGGQGRKKFSLSSEGITENQEGYFHERMRAAELLGHYFHLFDESAEEKEGFYRATYAKIPSFTAAPAMN